MLIAASSTGAALTAAIVSGGIALVVGILNYRAQARVVVTSRFTQAVGQLGAGEPDVRVGAIYALEQILRTSKAERRAIIELLVSFVRWHTRERAEEDGESDKPPMEPDVQAAMTVLGRRPRTRLGQALKIDRQEAGERRFAPAAVRRRAREPYAAAALKLGETRLVNANLPRADLRKSELYKVDFRCAVLREAGLRGANLAQAKLQNADLHRADLRDVNLFEAELFDADLRGAKLDAANLEQADLTEADLRGADLREARGLRQATLTRAKTNGGTKWPADFDWEAAGVTEFDDSRVQALV
jgi:hypothetical protein